MDFMNRDDFILRINALSKLVRTEYQLTQEKMAHILGISKKTLVESEKGRRNLGWTECALLAMTFSASTVLQNEFGGDIQDMVQSIAFDDMHVSYPYTMGGKVWWTTVEETDGFRIQQNIVSGHYRILNADNQRLMSSFSLTEVRAHLAGEKRT